MSERINKTDNRATIRWKLLTGASALALSAYVSSYALAHAEDTSRPQFWAELGGQLSRLEDGQETFAPPLFDNRPAMFEPSQKFERPPLYSIDEFASLSFQPENSDWVFSASVRYGRSAGKRHVHQQTYPSPFVAHRPGFSGSITNPAIAAKFADTRYRDSESHSILDFQAGKDVGLGLFGHSGASSVIAVGVRFAQFAGRTNTVLKSDPDWHFQYKYPTPHFKAVIAQPYHSNRAEFDADRSFHGIGPSLSWKSSMPFAGNKQGGELDMDWGLNAALLFGKQRARVHHQTTGLFDPAPNFRPPPPAVVYHPTPVTVTRTKSVTVPNVGGFAGISYQFTNAKLSLGYRADFFFNAIDGGIDTHKSENRAFYGPYASISIGLGD